MKTVIETDTFVNQAKKVWSDEERMDFISFIAKNPLAGEVIPKADGARKVRWIAKGKGKRGGARIIYVNVPVQGVLVLVAIYAKNKQENMNSNEIKRAV